MPLVKPDGIYAHFLLPDYPPILAGVPVCVDTELERRARAKLATETRKAAKRELAV